MKKSLLWISALTVLAVASAWGNPQAQDRVLARIDGKPFTESEFAARLAAGAEPRVPDILANEESRRREFNTILEKRLQSLAAQKSLGKSPELRRRLASTDERVITQYYFETHLGLFGGYTRAQVEAYYQENPARFADASGEIPAFTSIMSRVADSLMIREGALDSFYNANRLNYAVPPSVEISVIRTKTRANANAALKALRGDNFAEVAKRYSVHPTRENGGRIARLNRGEYHDALGNQFQTDSLLFDPSTRLRPGRTSGIVATGDHFIIVRMERETPERIPELAEIFTRVATDYLAHRRDDLNRNGVERLREKYQVERPERTITPSERELLAFYESNRDRYTSPEQYDLYHIVVADTTALSRELRDVTDLASFQALAERLTENPLLKARKGHLGAVKRDHALPFGIGVLPALFPALDEISSGRVGELVEEPASQTWHAFWLVSKTPSTTKPFERVKTQVTQDFRQSRINSYQPNDIHAVVKGTGRVVRESDVLFLRKEIPEQAQQRFTRENLVDFVVIWDISSAESRKLGLDKEARLRGMRLQNEDDFWANLYRDSLQRENWGRKPAELEKAFKARRELFTRSEFETWKAYAQDVAASLQLTEDDYRIEYNTYPERYTRDSTLIPFEEARSAMFSNLRTTAQARLNASLLNDLKKRFKVKVLDPTLEEPSLEPVAETFKRAQELHYERRLEQALALYERLRAAYPKRAGLQDSVSFGIAQILIEMERYPQAMAEYRRVSYLNPNSPDDYKAMFMVGFIQAEHLRQDSAAVRSFEAMLKKHPESDLSDDADWMLRNIRSGGELLPLLEDDEESGDAEAPDNVPAK